MIFFWLTEQFKVPDKWSDPDADEANICDHCVCCAQPNKFFNQSTTSTATHPIEPTELVGAAQGAQPAQLANVPAVGGSSGLRHVSNK